VRYGRRNTTPGEPEYTLTVIDELKNEYEAAAKAYSAVGGRRK
jgi:hypothetical protein